MSALRGILAGSLGLAALQAVLSTNATKNLGTLTKFPGDVVRWFLDPARPLIPDMRTDQTRSIGAAIQGAYANAGSMAGAGALGGALGLPAVPGGGSSGSGPTQGLGQLPVIPKKQQPKIVLPPAKLPAPGPLRV